MSPKRQHTTTSPFGTAGRVSHNADPFYASRLYSDQPQEQAQLPNASEHISALLLESI